MQHCYLGIDPGKKGGIVCITPGEIYATSMPESETAVWEWLTELGAYIEGKYELTLRACIEKVTGYVAGDGEHGIPGSRALVLGVSYGGLRMALAAMGFVEDITYKAVAPQTWQKGLGIKRDKGEKRPAWKRRLKELAHTLFPSEKIVGDTADAFLLARYCQMLYGGE